MKSNDTPETRIESCNKDAFKMIKRRKGETARFTFRLCIMIALMTTIFLLILQTQENEAKKIKIKLKDLKKAKKYAYLLAGQRKKTYAIPFPVPLPVFIKRQHIYTQIPVVPRYVQQPSYYGSSNYETQDPYGSMSAYMPDVKMPETPYAYGPPMKYQSGGGYPFATGRSRYLSQFASALGHAYPMSAYTPPREVVGKLLTGQAKVLSPKSLISSLKASSPITKAIQEQQDSGTKSTSESSSSSSSSSGSSNSTTSASSTSNASSTKDSSNKPSASENHLSLFKPPAGHNRMQRQRRHRPNNRFYPSDFYNVPAMIPYAPYLAGRPMIPRIIPVMHPQMQSHPQIPLPPTPASTTNELLNMQTEQQLLEAAAGTMPTPESEGDMETSGSQDHEVSASGNENAQATAQQKQLLDTMRLMHHHRQQAIIRAALIRERDARLAESHAAMVRAHQMGVAVVPQQVRLVNY